MVFHLCGLSLYGQGDQNNNPDSVTNLKQSLQQDASSDNGVILSKIKAIEMEVTPYETDNSKYFTPKAVEHEIANSVIETSQVDCKNEATNCVENNADFTPKINEAWSDFDQDWAKTVKSRPNSNETPNKSMKFLKNSDEYRRERGEPQEAWLDPDVDVSENRIFATNSCENDENSTCCWRCVFGNRGRRANVVACAPSDHEGPQEIPIVSQIRKASLPSHTSTAATVAAKQEHIETQQRQQQLLRQLQQQQLILDQAAVVAAANSAYAKEHSPRPTNGSTNGPRAVSSAPGSHQTGSAEKLRISSRAENDASLPDILRPASTQTNNSYLLRSRTAAAKAAVLAQDAAMPDVKNSHGDTTDVASYGQRSKPGSPVASAMTAVTVACADISAYQSRPNSVKSAAEGPKSPAQRAASPRSATPSATESPYQTPERTRFIQPQILRQDDNYVVRIESHVMQTAASQPSTNSRTSSPVQNTSEPATPKRRPKPHPGTPKEPASRASTPQRSVPSRAATPVHAASNQATPRHTPNRGSSHQGTPHKDENSKQAILATDVQDEDIVYVVKQSQRIPDDNSSLCDVASSETSSTGTNQHSIADDTPRGGPSVHKKPLYLTQRSKRILPTTDLKHAQRISRSSSKNHSIYGISPVRNQANAITPFENVKEGLTKTLRDLESSDWEKNVCGFKGMTRLLRYHNDVVESSLHPLAALLAKHILNLRSQVSRAACQAAGELFTVPRRGLDAELDDITQPLLHRTADTNRFLRADADAALDTMCDRLAAHRVVYVATGKSASHASAVVRGTCARLLSRLVQRVGRDKIFSLNKDYRDRVLITGAKFLQEGSLDTRSFAKQMFQELNKHEQFSKIIVEVLPSRTLRNIEKTLRSIH